MSEQNKTKEEPKKKLFNFVMSNPPYQETLGGTNNIDIWPGFVDAAVKTADCACIIHPARWIIPKKTMRATRDMLIADGLKDINHYPDASKIFPRAAIDAGVSMTYFEDGYNGPIKYYNEGQYYSNYDPNVRFVTNDYEKEIVEKLLTPFAGKPTMMDRVRGNIGSLGGGEFGYKKEKQIQFLRNTDEDMSDPIKIWANPGFGKGSRFEWMFIERTDLENIPEGLMDSRKVMVDKKGHAISERSANIINNIPQIVDKNVTANGVLFIFPERDEDYDLQLIKSMFMTKTIRFLMTITQKDLYVRGFENIPDYTLFIPMLNGGLFTDKFFYKTFGFSKELIDYIEFHISPKTE